MRTATAFASRLPDSTASTALIVHGALVFGSSLSSRSMYNDVVDRFSADESLVAAPDLIRILLLDVTLTGSSASCTAFTAIMCSPTSIPIDAAVP
jgi:hypothetical protein